MLQNKWRHEICVARWKIRLATNPKMYKLRIRNKSYSWLGFDNWMLHIEWSLLVYDMLAEFIFQIVNFTIELQHM